MTPEKISEKGSEWSRGLLRGRDKLISSYLHGHGEALWTPPFRMYGKQGKLFQWEGENKERKESEPQGPRK